MHHCLQRPEGGAYYSFHQRMVPTAISTSRDQLFSPPRDQKTRGWCPPHTIYASKDQRVVPTDVSTSKNTGDGAHYCFRFQKNRGWCPPLLPPPRTGGRCPLLFPPPKAEGGADSPLQFSPLKRPEDGYFHQRMVLTTRGWYLLPFPPSGD